MYKIEREGTKCTNKNFVLLKQIKIFHFVYNILCNSMSVLTVRRDNNIFSQKLQEYGWETQDRNVRYKFMQICFSVCVF